MPSQPLSRRAFLAAGGGALLLAACGGSSPKDAATKPGAGATSTTVRSKALGFSIRMVEQYQIGTDQNPSRLDILIGAATLQARLACRVWG